MLLRTAARQPSPAYGPDNPAAPISENPPLSGLDMPGLEPHAAPLSYLQPGVMVSETADSNVADTLGQSSLRSVSEALGSLTLQRLWSHYDLALDYLGGVAYYNAHGVGWKLLQQMDVAQRITWKRGQLAVRDSFSYLPEGNFGAEYGSLGGRGLGSVGSSSFGTWWGGSTLGGLAEVPRVSNLALADVSENLSPRSAITAAGGYAFTHFTGNPVLGTVPLENNSFLGSSQLSAQAGYNRVITPHDQVALVYGYQRFDFTAQGTAFHSQVIQGMYGHRVSGRMDFLVGAGPQITSLSFGGADNTRIGVAGRAQLRYRFTKTMMEASYERYETSGSGFFAGAQSDMAQVRLSRPITRSVDRIRRPRLFAQHPSATACDQRRAGEHIQLRLCRGRGAADLRTQLTSYLALTNLMRFSFDSSFCSAQGVSTCNRISQRHLVTMGLEWTPRPIRID